jgi:threonine dehydrogenase-like Zn-dependent dehydrogenase
MAMPPLRSTSVDCSPSPVRSPRAPGCRERTRRTPGPERRWRRAGISLAPDTIEPARAIPKDVDLRFCLYYSAAEFAETLELPASGAIDAAPLVTGHVGLDGVAAAFARLGSSPTDAKILIDSSL